MMILDFFEACESFFQQVLSFFQKIGNEIKDFFLQYMSEDVLNVLIFGVLLAIILIVILAIINRK